MEFGRGGIKELFVDLWNLNFVRCFLKLAFGISRLRLWLAAMVSILFLK